MQPFCRILANGSDITGNLSDRLLSIEVHDEAEDKSDRVTIRLDDRARFADGGMLAIPLIGTTVSVIMGYRDGAAADMGSYLIDDITVDSPPRTLTVTGRAAAMPNAYRTPRTQSYHQKTLGAIMQEIAGRSGYEAKVDPELAGVVVRHADQLHESDMAFATRLAALHDGVARPVDGKLAVAKRGTGKSITGAALPVITLTETMCASWRFQYSARDEAGEAGGLDGGGGTDQQAAGDSRLPQSVQMQSAGNLPALSAGAAPGQKGGVRAYWHDIRTGEKKEVTVGQEPFHDLRYTHHNEAEAKAAVSAYRNKSLRGKASFSCMIGGRPQVRAECKLILSGFRPYIPAEWRIKSASHRYEPGGGYTTSIQAELFEEKQEDTPANVKKTTPTTDDKIDPDAPAEPVQGGGGSSGGDIIHMPE